MPATEDPAALESTGQADLGLLTPVHPCPERRGEQLGAEADAPHRSVRLHGLAQQALLLHEPRMVGLVVGAHRAAHHHDRRKLPPIRQRLALVELDASHVEPP